MTRARGWHGRLEVRPDAGEGPPAAPAVAGEWPRTEVHGGMLDGRAEGVGSSLPKPARRVRASTRRTDVRACPGAHSAPDAECAPAVGIEGKTAARAGAEEGSAAGADGPEADGGMKPVDEVAFHREARGRVVA